MRVFSADHYYWRMVERDADTPWFCLTIEFKINGRVRERTLMPNDNALLSEILEQQSKGIEIRDLQVMTPGTINKQGRWLMEPLAQLELGETKHGAPVEIFTTIFGRTYYYPTLTQAAIKSIRARNTLYKKHDGNTAQPRQAQMNKE